MIHIYHINPWYIIPSISISRYIHTNHYYSLLITIKSLLNHYKSIHLSLQLLPAPCWGWWSLTKCHHGVVSCYMHIMCNIYIYICMYLSIYLSNLLIYVSMYLCNICIYDVSMMYLWCIYDVSMMYLSIYLSLSVCLSVYLCLSVCLFIYSSIHLSIYPSIHLSSIHLSIYLRI